MKPDYLYGTPYTIMQPPGMYHFSSDTEFLGRMLEAKQGDHLLDIGTNTGALLFYGAVHGAKLYGIDLFAENCEAARRNLAMNALSGTIYEGRIQDFEHEPFDVIVCNPPYFATKNEKLKNSNPFLRAARHEEYLNPDDLFASASRLLKKDGSFWIVHRAARCREMIHTAAGHGLYPHVIRVSLDHRGGTKKSCVMCFRFENAQPVIYAPAYMDCRDSFAEKEAAVCTF